MIMATMATTVVKVPPRMVPPLVVPLRAEVLLRLDRLRSKKFRTLLPPAHSVPASTNCSGRTKGPEPRCKGPRPLSSLPPAVYGHASGVESSLRDYVRKEPL